VKKTNWHDVLDAVTGPALQYLDSLPDRPVYRVTDPDEVRALVAGPLPEGPTPAPRCLPIWRAISNHSSPRTPVDGSSAS
jgi:hypothetical protein